MPSPLGRRESALAIGLTLPYDTSSLSRMQSCFQEIYNRFRFSRGRFPANLKFGGTLGEEG